MTAARNRDETPRRGTFLRTAALTLPALLALGAGASALGLQPQDAKPALKKADDVKKDVQDLTKGVKDLTKDVKDVTKDAEQDAKKNRLTGKDAPPPPLVVPRAKPAPVPVPVQGKPRPQPQFGSGDDIFGPQKPLSPEQLKQQQAKLEAQGKGGQGNLIPGKPRGPRPPVNPKAKLEIPFGSETHDFGRVRQGDEMNHTFELKSSGEQPVIISQASPTCGCLVGEIKTKPPGAETFEPYVLGDSIVPGTDVTIDAVIQTAAKQNKTQVRINVYTNDPVGLTQLALHANVEPYLRATPSFLQLGDVPEGEERTGRIDVRTSRGEKVMLTVDNTRNIPLPEGFSYELIPVNADAEGKSNHWQVSMRVSPESKEGPKGYALSLITDIELPKTAKTEEQEAKMAALGKSLGPQQKYYSINTNVNYRILGVLSVSPQYLSMGLVRPGQPVVRNVKLIAQDPNFDLSGATVELRGEQGQPLNWAENFSTSVRPAAGMNALDIQLNLAGLPEGADGSFRGELAIDTGHPSKPEMIVRFSGVCRKLSGGR